MGKIIPKIKNLVKIDFIRLTKFIEMFQYTTLSFIIGIAFGHIINKFLDDEPNEKDTTLEICLDLLKSLFLITVSLYYGHKILKIIQVSIPFFLKLSSKYIPCHKSECSIGTSLGFSLSFMHTLTKFKRKLEILVSRI